MLGVSPQKRSLSDGRAEADGRQTAAAGNYGGDHRPTTYRPPLPSLPSPAHRFATVQLQRSIEPAFLSYQQPQQVYSNPYQQQQVYSNPYQQQVFNFNYQQQQQQDNYIRQPVVQNQYDFAQQRSFTSQQYF